MPAGTPRASVARTVPSSRAGRPFTGRGPREVSMSAKRHQRTAHRTRTRPACTTHAVRVHGASWCGTSRHAPLRAATRVSRPRGGRGWSVRSRAVGPAGVRSVRRIGAAVAECCGMPNTPCGSSREHPPVRRRPARPSRRRRRGAWWRVSRAADGLAVRHLGQRGHHERHRGAGGLLVGPGPTVASRECRDSAIHCMTIADISGGARATPSSGAGPATGHGGGDEAAQVVDEPTSAAGTRSRQPPGPRRCRGRGLRAPSTRSS